MEGRSNWTGEPNFWKGQIKQMMMANIDMLYVHLIPSSEQQRINLFQALNQLRFEGYDVPKVAPFLDPMITWDQQPLVNVATAAGKDTFVNQYIRFFNQYYSVNPDAYADDYLARIANRVVLDTWHVKFNLTNLGSLTRQDVTNRLVAAFGPSHPVFSNGIYMVTTALNDPTLGFADEKVPQFEISQYYRLHSHLGTVAVQLKGGYWDQNIRNPGSILKRDGGWHFTNAWSMINRTTVRRVYVESWNEYDEGSGIYAANTGAPYIQPGSGNTNTDSWSGANDPYEYIKTSARGAAAFNDTPERDAKILWHNIPNRMTPGETRKVTVIVRNEGDVKWTEAAKYRFGQKDYLDPVMFGPGRYLINDTQDEIPTYGGIFRGRPKTFQITLRAPMTPGVYTTHWGMLQELVAWFGEEIVQNITVDPTPILHGSPQSIDSTMLLTNRINDFTEHTYTVNNLPVGSFADCSITRTFAAPIKSIKVGMVAGTADDIGYVGDILVTPDSLNTTCQLGHVTGQVDVTSAVAVSRNLASLTLRARDTCCCNTGWGEDTVSGRINARLRWEVELLPPSPISPVFSNAVTGHYYVLLSPATWSFSERAAVALGGHLTTIRSQAEQDWIYDTFSSFGGLNRLLWIGLNDVGTEGRFVWSSSESVNFTYWATGEPNNALTGEDFVTMYQPGHTYAARWNDWGERVFDGNRPFNGVVEIVSPNGPPRVIAQPQSQAVYVCESGKFAVTATGTAPLNYQWLFNEVILPGATNSNLTLNDVQTVNIGDYKVVVTNSVGSITSSVAFLVVNPSPTNSGSVDRCFIAKSSATDYINTLGLQSDGKIVIGGFSVNGADRNAVARLNLDGSLDTTFGPPLLLPGYAVRSLAIQPDDKIIIAGFILGSKGVTRLNSNGSLDGSFNPNAVINNLVETLVLQPDGKVLIGGFFTSVNGSNRKYIARLNEDGSLDTSFDTSQEVNEAVFAIVVQSDGKIVIGGQFSSVNNISRNHIARLNSDGSLDATFNPGLGTGGFPSVPGTSGGNGSVLALALQPDGKIVIGGEFSSFNGTSRHSIARLNRDGSLDTTFDPGSGAKHHVYALAVQADGKVLLGGAFTTINETNRNHIARLKPDGSLDSTFDPGTGANNFVNALVVQSDTKVLLAGNFTSVDSVPRNRIARLNGDVSNPSAPTIFTQPEGQKINVGATVTFTVTAIGTPPLKYQWRFNGANIAGATNPLYTLTDIQFADAGNYSVLAANLLGQVESLDATLIVNHSPVANPQALSSDEDSLVPITLSGTDADDDALAYGVVTSPAHGSLAGVAPNLTYRPAANYNGPDSFTFKVNDSLIDSIPATISISVLLVDDPPFAQLQSLTLNEDTALPITLAASDVDGDKLTYSIVTQPTRGTLTGTPPNVTYVGATNYNGPDSFTFKANDGHVDSEPATVDITIAAVNDSPVAVAKVSPLFSLSTNDTNPVVFSPDGVSAIVIFDGSNSSDVENDTLQYFWFEEGQTNAFATGVTVTNEVPVGEYMVALLVSDGQDTGTNRVSFSVISLAQAVADLVLLVEQANLGTRNKRPIFATLEAAIASLDRDKFKTGINQLGAFQNKVRAQIAPFDAALADTLILAAQKIIAAIGSP